VGLVACSNPGIFSFFSPKLFNPNGFRYSRAALSLEIGEELMSPRRENRFSQTGGSLSLWSRKKPKKFVHMRILDNLPLKKKQNKLHEMIHTILGNS
jgi:hypothetical protein